MGGRGNRQLLNKWFNSSSYVHLATTEVRYFSIKDLIKFGHVKAEDEGAWGRKGRGAFKI